MPISKDLSHLPDAVHVPVREGFEPLTVPSVGNALVDSWWEDYASDPENLDRPMSHEGAMFRHSWAAMCARRIGYEMAHIPKSNPPDKAAIWRMNLGTLIHDALQAKSPYANNEMAVRIERASYFTAGTADIVIDFEGSEDPDGTLVSGYRVCVEVKTINGYAFKLAASNFRGAPEGPRFSAIVQAALNAVGCEADEARVVYLSMENLSPTLRGLSEGEYAPFLAEWVIHDFKEIAADELARIDMIVQLHREGLIPDRVIPDPEMPKGARIVDVGTEKKKPRWQLSRAGQIIDTGETWHCNYCSYQDRCRADGQGRVPFDPSLIVAAVEAPVAPPVKKAAKATTKKASKEG